MLVVIAWRNIWRNPLRSLTIIGSVMIGLWAGIFILAFFRGMTNEQIRTAISQQLSHIQLHHPQFRELDEPEFTVRDVTKLDSIFSREPAIGAISRRMIITAMASSAYTSSGVSIYGIDPAAENAVTGLAVRTATGRYFDTSTHSQLLIGKKLAAKLHLELNSKLVLTFQDTKGELTASAFRICGIYTAANSSMEENNVYVKQKELDSLATLRGQVHEIAVLLKDNAFLDQTARLIQQASPGNKTETWKQLSPELRLMIDSFGQYMMIIIGIILVALVFGIVNTMLMAVLERVRELGVLMAIGLNKSKVFRMIITETILMTILGCMAGLPLAWVTVYLTGRSGISLERFAEGLALYGYGTKVYPQLESIYYWQVGAMALGATIIAAIYPAWKALQLNPATAIRKI
ncbi:ABC transporter permease [Flavihumibacter rivuli]|uniref:ABC transporter permease n=1 Tax=Flavihumibacter rivuli TaxID=2838156 RepID=UPI001BDDFCD3|nr:ABC transporter permease [Flavihumibacter rivuli]ULQ55545.1 ABC transporter permease [Flavihumibacter rivuli]